MEYDYVEAAIAEQAESPVQATEQAETTQNDVASEAPENGAEPEQKQQSKTHKEPWPKTAVNQFNKKKAEVQRLKSEVSQLKAKIAELQPPTDEEWTGPYAELVETRASVGARRDIANERLKALEAEQEQAESELIATKLQESGARAAEYTKSINDYQQTVQPYAELIYNAPAEIQMLLVNAPDTAMAVYGLAKIGVLEDVLSLPPNMAAAYIAQGEMMGRLMSKNATNTIPAMVQAPQVSQAPRPIAMGGSSSNVGSKDPLKMDNESFSKWLAS
jgi:hypothetical protein